MTIVDKVIAAVTPPESDEARAEARAKARATAGKNPGGWLAQILDHHLEIESAFEAVRTAGMPAERRAAQKQLGRLLTGHSMAEEAVIYSAMASHGEKVHSAKAYFEQSAAKIQMAALEELDPMSQDYLDKLEHLRGAVAHHVYEEEGDWFPDLADKGGPELQDRLTHRYAEEYGQYSGSSKPASKY